jgi:predicted O-methyltransferase YrrM
VKKRYCEQHGYEFICAQQVLDPSRPIAWSKIPLILKTMENPAVKWVFWTDADSVITNLGVRLEDLVDDQHNLIIGRDIHALNSGQLLVRNCDWSRQFLKRVYDHRECLHHIWWEQQALITELYQHPEHWAHVKEVPQRLFNSYGVEYFPGPKSGWQAGDFIVHFPGVRDLGELKTRLEEYAARAVNDSKQITLDSYLNMHGLAPERSLTKVQSMQWQRKLSSYPQIKRIAEIGLHTGHHADQFLRSCPNLQTLVAFDAHKTRPTRVASEYLQRTHKDHFDFIPADSAQTINNYLATHHTKFDLIHIDAADPLAHIKNARPLSHPNTILWIENYHEPAVQQAVAQAIHQGILVADITHVTCERDGQQRKWLEAHYAPAKVTLSGLIGAFANPKSNTTIVR